MAFSLTWLPEVLKSAGLKVAVVPGWESRGRGDIGTVLGVLCHHTAGAKTGNMPTLNLLVNGRSDLPGPLSQLGLGRDGTYYVIAAGRCNHAGNGNWKGVTAGNTHFIGIEAEHTGAADVPWPDVQMEAYQRGVAAILKHIGKPADFCAGHKEYAPKRKPDPGFDMNEFRVAVAAFMDGTAPDPKPIAIVEPVAQPGAEPGRTTLRRGAKGDLVKQLQASVGVGADGNFGPRTEAAVRAFQRDNGLVPDGIVGPATWAALDHASADKT
jgi:peptidoglycan hydrolase-like protein with peptidoglycan-binding domain